MPASLQAASMTSIAPVPNSLFVYMIPTDLTLNSSMMSFAAQEAIRLSFARTRKQYSLSSSRSLGLVPRPKKGIFASL